MPWRFVGRAEQLGQLCRALQNPASGPIVLAGEQGMGRTALITRALVGVDPEHTRIVRVRPAGSAPLSALQASLPGRLPASLTPDEAARAVGRALSGPRSGPCWWPTTHIGWTMPACWPCGR